MRKIWNWQLDQWPHFSFDEEALKPLEYAFSQENGIITGTFKHIEQNDKDALLVEILSNEALNTSAIEGEYLNRDSIQASIKKGLGLSVEKHKVPPAEYGISEMMVDLYSHYNKSLTHQELYEWHKMITNGRRDLSDIGCYRTHEDAMQIVSNRLDRPKVHFEAPPSHLMMSEMTQFITWFNNVHQQNNTSLLPITRAGIAHYYFINIHPFEDGNGRIGRALVEKSISQSLGRPTLIALSNTIEKKKKDYYTSLEKHNTTCEITDWLVYFGQTIIDAQKETMNLIDFLIEKAKFFDRFASQMNERQTKVIKRVFQAGHQGFEGGLSAENYTRIAKTSASTATRDLKSLLDQKILIKTGTLKSTRYWLNIKSNTH